ncbi:hypothetical protein KCP75_04230 [Salmonella enterica subsp. enterica]|nr:hypothetical protein KCP75_04230 [Salmonella enterica subsp. enterica]
MVLVFGEGTLVGVTGRMEKPPLRGFTVVVFRAPSGRMRRSVPNGNQRALHVSAARRPVSVARFYFFALLNRLFHTGGKRMSLVMRGSRCCAQRMAERRRIKTSIPVEAGRPTVGESSFTCEINHSHPRLPYRPASGTFYT